MELDQNTQRDNVLEKRNQIENQFLVVFKF